MSAERAFKGPDAGQVSRLLAGQAEQLCRELLSSGRRHGDEWRVGSVGNEPGESTGVHLRGAKAGVWADFSTGESGDALDLVASVHYRGDKKAAYAWALRWLGIRDGDAPRTVVAYIPPAREAGPDVQAASRQRAALRLWLEARPSLADTPADLYLQGRGIRLAELGRQPRALRFHPACRCTEAERDLPALVAAITDGEGRHVATHRTWLWEHPDGWGKARLRDPKKTLGRPRGGTIRLWRGESGKALRDAPDGEAVVLGEGIETCLSVAIACPALRVLCGVSIANEATVALPPQIRVVILAADNDGENAPARDGFQRVVNRFLADGREVRIARAPHGKDFNDCIRVGL